MPQLMYTETLVVVHCTCGIAFGIPDELHRQMNKSGTSVYCPLGHRWHYSESLEEKLQRERDRSARLQADLDQKEAALRAQKSVTTKLRKKVARAEHGVCPHCNRSFQNLQRHVKTKHPGCL